MSPLSLAVVVLLLGKRRYWERSAPHSGGLSRSSSSRGGSGRWRVGSPRSPASRGRGQPPPPQPSSLNNSPRGLKGYTDPFLLHFPARLSIDTCRLGRGQRAHNHTYCLNPGQFSEKYDKNHGIPDSYILLNGGRPTH